MKAITALAAAALMMTACGSAPAGLSPAVRQFQAQQAAWERAHPALFRCQVRSTRRAADRAPVLDSAEAVRDGRHHLLADVARGLAGRKCQRAGGLLRAGRAAVPETRLDQFDTAVCGSSDAPPAWSGPTRPAT